MLKANKQMIEHWKGAESMFDILMEIMEPQIEAMLKEEREKAIMIGEQNGEQLGIQTGKIQGTIDTLREFGHPESDIKARIMKKYNLSPSEADNYLSGVITSELPFQ